MPFNRKMVPENFHQGDQLYEDLIGIGFRLTGDKYTRDVNIENTLVAASIGGLIHRMPRVIPLLTDWITIHHRRINMDRLYKLLVSLDPKKFEAAIVYWTANAQRLRGDTRTGVRKIASLYRGQRRDFLSLQDKDAVSKNWSDRLIQKHGEDQRFLNTCMRVPNQTIRHRPRDVLKPKDLAQFHLLYRYRIMFGATYRADMWAALRKNPASSASDVARFSYGSQPMAREVRLDYLLVKRDYSSRRV